mgnify:CR=1 FL=1
MLRFGAYADAADVTPDQIYINTKQGPFSRRGQRPLVFCALFREDGPEEDVMKAKEKELLEYLQRYCPGRENAISGKQLKKEVPRP